MKEVSINLIISTLALLFLSLNSHGEEISHKTKNAKKDVQVKNDVLSLNEETLGNLFKLKNGIFEKNWEYIVLHHSATGGGIAKAFDQYHRNAFRDPLGLEYHFVIDNGIGKGSIDGLIEVSERWKKQTFANHLFRPELALKSIAICLVGNFEKRDSITKNQLHYTIKLILELVKRYKIPLSNVITHEKIDGTNKNDGRPVTVCPGKFFPYKKIIERLDEEKTKTNK